MPSRLLEPCGSGGIAVMPHAAPCPRDPQCEPVTGCGEGLVPVRRSGERALACVGALAGGAQRSELFDEFAMQGPAWGYLALVEPVALDQPAHPRVEVVELVGFFVRGQACPFDGSWLPAHCLGHEIVGLLVRVEVLRCPSRSVGHQRLTDDAGLTGKQGCTGRRCSR